MFKRKFEDVPFAETITEQKAKEILNEGDRWNDIKRHMQQGNPMIFPGSAVYWWEDDDVTVKESKEVERLLLGEE